MTEYKEAILIVFFLLSFIVAYWLIVRSFSDAWSFMRVVNTPNMLNDDASVISKVTPLVKEAKEIIEIYDDGENFPGSMYNDEDFVNTVEEKLASSNIRIECLFNEGRRSSFYLSPYKKSASEHIHPD